MLLRWLLLQQLLILDTNIVEVGASKISPSSSCWVTHERQSHAAVLSTLTRAESACVGCQNSRLLTQTGARALSFLSKCSPPSRGQWANIFYIRRRPTHMYVQWISRVHSIPRRRSYCRIYARPTWNIFTPISACLKRKKGQDAKPLLALQNWFAKLDWSYQIAKHTSEPYWIVNEWQTWSVISNRLQITVMIKDCNYNRNRLHFSKSNRNVIDYIFDVIVIKNLTITNYKKKSVFREKLELLQLKKIFL